MSESTRKTVPLLVSREQARQLAEWAEDSTPCIYKQGHFAYFEGNHVVVRWDVEGLDVPDGSWIDLIRYPDRCNGKPDTLTNMANWAWTADQYDYWDLMDEKRWGKEDGVETRGCEKLFTRARSAATPMAFCPSQLTGLSLVVAGSKYGPVALAPTREDRHGPLWVMGHDKRVAGLCEQINKFHSSEDYMPEAYQEKNKGGKK